MNKQNKRDEDKKGIDWGKAFFTIYFLVAFIFLLWLLFVNDTHYEHSAEDRDYGRAVYYGGSWH